jgi:hypothetical protein
MPERADLECRWRACQSAKASSMSGRSLAMAIRTAGALIWTPSVQVPCSSLLAPHFQIAGCSSGARIRPESDTQPNIPPCALIIFKSHFLKLRKIRSDTILRHETIVPTVIGFTHRRVDTDFRSHPRDNQLLDTAILQDCVEVGSKKKPPCQACRPPVPQATGKAPG